MVSLRVAACIAIATVVTGSPFQPEQLAVATTAVTGLRFAAQIKQTGSIVVEQVSLAGIQIDATEAEVRRVLGQPRQVENLENAAIGAIRRFTYPGLLVELAEGEANQYFVFHWVTTSPRYQTSNGVKVGDSETKVLQIYGDGERTQQAAKTVLTYRVKDTYITLSFELVNRKVTKIVGFLYLN